MASRRGVSQNVLRQVNDYGAPLQFGSFITPAADDPLGVVALAVASETAGLDLVCFQDDPYRRAFLDAWTLMSFVAARTDRIQISANVHNLPLRPPAVLARAAASLDLLSAGRFALALGAGAFWDAVVAMGGERRSPGARASDSRLARCLRAADAADRRNPGRRMAAVDGPARSLSAITTGNARIDDEAANAGRDPAAIRRADGAGRTATRGRRKGYPAQPQ